MNRPTKIQSQVEAASVQPQFTFPRGNVLRLAVVREEIGVSFSLPLLKRRFPFACFRTVIVRIFRAANRMFRARFWSHILKEISKSVSAKPAVAHFNPSCAVIFVALVVGMITSAVYGFPASVTWGSDKFSFGIHNPIRILTRNAAAGFGVITAEVHSENLHDVSAITAAIPPGFVAFSSGRTAENRKPIVFFSSQIEGTRSTHVIYGLNSGTVQRNATYSHYVNT